MNTRAGFVLLLPLCLGALAMLPPKVDAVTPLGGRRGTEVEVTLRGARLGEPQALLFVRPGIEVLAVTAGKDANACTAKLRIAADCALGAQPLRLRTASGLSNLMQLFVGDLPELQEDRKAGAPQVVEAPCTIDGAIAGEEIDRYQLTLPKGAPLLAEVEAMRLGRGPLDLALTVLGPDGSTLAEVDDTALGHKDPFAVVTTTQAGVHEVRVRAAFADSANDGAYRLHLGALPRPTAALPCGGAPGTTLHITMLGEAQRWPFDAPLPNDGDEWTPCFPRDARGSAPTPIWLRTGGPPEVTPQANGDAPPRVTFPGSVSGVVDRPAGARFVFAADKGAAFELRALAAGLHSPLDPVLSVIAADGKVLAADDDGAAATGIGDSLLRFSAPAAGDYTVVVRDLLARSGPAHAFRLEVGTPPRSTRTRLVIARGQEPVLNVPRGGATGGVLQLDLADAKELEQSLAFAALDLPAGVQATFGALGKGSNLVPFVLTAAADAPPSGALADLRLRAEQEPRERPAGYAQVLPLVTVRNDQPILTTTQRKLPVAVTAAAPFTLAIDAPKVPLIRGASLRVPVRIVRAAGFAGDVRLKALWTPPGVGSGEVTVPKDQDHAELPLDANGNAPLGAFALAVTASATVGNEGFEQGSTFAMIDVQAPWLTVTTAGARTTIGTATSLAIELHAEHPFDGPLQARVLGLPKGVTAPPLTLDATATKAALAIAVDATAQPSRLRDLALEVRVPHAGGEVLHRFAVGELRIDAPPTTPAAPAAPKEPAR